MIGEVLADLGHDPFLDVLMKGAAQVGEGARRRDNDQCRYGTLAHQMLQCGSDAGNEANLLQTVPVGLGDAAVTNAFGAQDGDAGPVGALLMSERVYVGEDLFGFQRLASDGG